MRLSISLTRPLLLLSASQAVVTLAGLIYGKLTALYIPPDEWGTYGLLLSSMTLWHGFFVTPTLQSAKAALVQFPTGQVVGFYSLILTLIYLLVGLATALSVGLYGHNSILFLIWIAAVGYGLFQFGNDYLNALGQHRMYTINQVSYSLGNLLLFNLIIIAAKDYTATALWQSLALINTIFAALAIWHLTRHQSTALASKNTAIRAELMQHYGHYIGPLLSLAFWNWIINYADRFLIRLYLTDTDVGQYTMGYSVGSKLLVIVAPLLSFLSPKVLQLRAAGQPSERANPLLMRYLQWYILVAGMACLVFYTGRNWLGQLLLSNRYQPAFPIGPVVAVGYLFLTSIHLLEVKWYAYGQTRLVLWHHIAGALLNVGLNLVLIPRLGILGAALATLLAFAGQFLLVVGMFMKSANG